jgi:hypothetical protein
MLYIGIQKSISVPNATLSVFQIFLGIFLIGYGLIGKELQKIHYYVKFDSGILRLKKSRYSKEVIIDLKTATFIKSISSGFEITFGDYVKTYDVSWLTMEEFQMLKSWVQVNCADNNLTIG